MILITIGGVLAIISLLGLWLCTVSDSNTKGLSGVCGFSLMVGMALIPAGVIEILPKKTTALDVYQDKATLEIIYKDSIPVDSAVVFKDKKD